MEKPLQSVASEQPETQASRLEALYGAFADVFRELGGGENFIRTEREQLHFRKDEMKETS